MLHGNCSALLHLERCISKVQFSAVTYAVHNVRRRKQLCGKPCQGILIMNSSNTLTRWEPIRNDIVSILYGRSYYVNFNKSFSKVNLVKVAAKFPFAFEPLKVFQSNTPVSSYPKQNAMKSRCNEPCYVDDPQNVRTSFIDMSCFLLIPNNLPKLL